MRINRVWAMPTGDTFDCPPMGEMVKRYLRASQVSIDPFARNKRWATYTNDLNPETAAEYHMDAYDFLVTLLNRGVKADLIIFDPPYSIAQSKQIYESFGAQKFTVEDAQNVGRWSREKEICYQLLAVGGYFLHFGWHSNGMGKGRDTQIEELLLVAHGSSHNDTICMAEKKLAHQSSLFGENAPTKRVCQTWFLLLSYLRYKWARGEETGLISDKTSNPWAPYVEKSIADFERGLTQRAADLAKVESEITVVKNYRFVSERVISPSR